MNQIMKTALTQLEEWIVKFENQNGTPTMFEIKCQFDMFKEIEKQQITDAVEETMYEMNLYDSFRTLKNGEQYYNETFSSENQAE